MRQQGLIFLVAIFSFIAGGCGKNFTAAGNASPEGKGNFVGAKISYSQVRDNILVPYCVACHGTQGGIRLESYSDLVKNSNAVYRSVFVTGSMPKLSVLPAEEKAFFKAWMDAGYPEFEAP